MSFNKGVVVIKDDDKDTEEDTKEMEEAEKSMSAKSVQELSKISKDYAQAAKEYDAKKKQQVQKHNVTKNETSRGIGPGANPGHDAPLPFPNNKPDKNGNFAVNKTKNNHTVVHNKTFSKAGISILQKNETHHKNKTGQNNWSKALNHTTQTQHQNMSQKNLTAKTNGTNSTLTAKNVSKPSTNN